MYNPFDYYYKKAKKQGYKARSGFKLEEIDNKYNIFDYSVNKVLDIGCAPGSWIQYSYKKLKDNTEDFTIIGIDREEIDLDMENVYTYSVFAENIDQIKEIISDHNIEGFDVMLSDIAPDTMGQKKIDSIKSMGLLENLLPIFQGYLKNDGKFVIKVFMGPGFDDFLLNLKNNFGHKNIKLYKPHSSRSSSKETYIIKFK